MEQNETITARFLNDEEFKKVITEFLIKRVYRKIREDLAVK
jgi:hypothetical protein